MLLLSLSNSAAESVFVDANQLVWVVEGDCPTPVFRIGLFNEPDDHDVGDSHGL